MTAQDHIAAIRAALDSGAASVEQAVGAYYERIIGIQPQSGAPVPVLVRPQDLRSILAYIGELEEQKAELVEALLKAEAALADIGDADREPGDDLAWCEERAAKDLPEVRSALIKAIGRPL